MTKPPFPAERAQGFQDFPRAAATPRILGVSLGERSPDLRVTVGAARGRGATERGASREGGQAPTSSGRPTPERRARRGMTSAVSATFQPISPASWHPNPGPPKPEATRANEEPAREEGQAAGLWVRRGPAARIQGAPASGPGVWRRRRGWAGAPGGRCRRRRHSAAMERPGAAVAGLSRWPHGRGLLLLLLLPLLPPATFGQDRLDAPPPPAAPLPRWAGPVGVSWGLRAAAPGGPAPRAGRWRRSPPAQDEGCGRVRDFVTKLANNTHQVSGRRARASPDCEAPPPGPPPAPLPRARAARRTPRAAAPKLRGSQSGPGGGPREPRFARLFRHRGGRRSLSRHSFFPSCQNLSSVVFRLCK